VQEILPALSDEEKEFVKEKGRIEKTVAVYHDHQEKLIWWYRNMLLI